MEITVLIIMDILSFMTKSITKEFVTDVGNRKI